MCFKQHLWWPSGDICFFWWEITLQKINSCTNLKKSSHLFEGCPNFQLRFWGWDGWTPKKTSDNHPATQHWIPSNEMGPHLRLGGFKFSLYALEHFSASQDQGEVRLRPVFPNGFWCWCFEFFVATFVKRSWSGFKDVSFQGLTGHGRRKYRTRDTRRHEYCYSLMDTPER